MEGESGNRRWNHHIGVNGNDTRIEHVAAGVNRVYHTVEGEGSATEQQPLVQAINNDDGTVGWQKEFEDTFFRGIALHESRVVVGTSQSLYLLDAATGDTIKELRFGTSAFGGLAKIEDTVYIADSEIKAYEVETGEQLWSETIGREPDSKILAQDDRLYAGTDAGFVVARSLTDGSKLWEANAGQSIETRPAVSNNIVWVGDATGNITGIDKETGASVYDNKLLQSSERMSIAALDSTLLVSGLYTDDSFALAHNINY
jgi:outer membrane protein assembly factor BamB